RLDRSYFFLADALVSAAHLARGLSLYCSVYPRAVHVAPLEELDWPTLPDYVHVVAGYNANQPEGCLPVYIELVMLHKLKPGHTIDEHQAISQITGYRVFTFYGHFSKVEYPHCGTLYHPDGRVIPVATGSHFKEPLREMNIKITGRCFEDT
ncbi:MAG: hypothetical protein AAFR56_18055, partial [Chloroflexota bacterium]